MRDPTPRLKRVVAIAPHADDVELGLGGYIHREITSGRATVEIYVLAGDPSEKKNWIWGPHPSHIRESEGAMAARVLGTDHYVFLHAASDSEFNMQVSGKIVKAIETVLAIGAADELFFPLESIHEDHRITHRACLAALRPHATLPRPKAVYCYEYPLQFWGTQVPSWGKIYAPLTEPDMTAKFASLACHHSQRVSDPSSILGREGVLRLSQQRGVECGAAYAELFYQVQGTL